MKDKVAVAKKYIEQNYNAVFVLKIVGLSRSTYYYNLSVEGKEKYKPVDGKLKGYSLTEKGKRICDDEMKEYILESIDRDAINYGYRKIMHNLKREYGLIINHKKVYRLCKELDILKNQRVKKPNIKRTIAINRTINGKQIRVSYIIDELENE